MDAVGVTHTGTVKFFDAKKGFGFIENTGLHEDVFVHISVIRDTCGFLETGQRVQFTVVENATRLRAVSLILLDAPRPGQDNALLFMGIVKVYDSVRNSGYIGSPVFTADVYFNAHAVKEGGVEFTSGDRVRFAVICNRGQACASHVELFEVAEVVTSE